jgi:hypothetical protein
MTANWAASVVWVLVLAFFVVCAIGIALGAYAANTLKKREGDTESVKNEPAAT